MGKKAKIGKQRRDKYYNLAKEAGYRSRAAFKLIQLNKRFEFLQNSRATVDLCAAPGGWMQVAVQNMPVSSLVVGVDLAPIKPIKNCIALQGDITTAETRAAIKKELKTWSADCVLHDGAPNVGLNWTHDAFQQNLLTLSAMKLATQILRKGGTFVTKVFRSNDYSCLIKVFEKLFKRVHVWKPAASRLESAEIFVVCEHYLKPDKVDPEYLDPKKVFSNPDGSESKGPNVQNLLIGKQKKAKAEGYDTDSLAVFQTVTATDFIYQGHYMDMLGVVNEIVLDDDKWKNSDKTTDEVKEYIKDVKVCGPRELRVLLRWRKALKEEQKKIAEEEKGEAEPVEEKILTADEIEDEEMRKIDEEIAMATESEKAALKKKKKRMLKEKAKLLKRRELKMIIDGDAGPQQEELELFSIMKIRKAQEMMQLKASLKKGQPEAEDQNDGEEEEMEDEEIEDVDDEEEMEWEGEDAFKQQTKKKYEPSKEITDKHTKNWFEQQEVSGMLSESDEEEDLAAVEKHMGRQKKVDYSNTVSFEDEKGKKKKKKGDEDDGFNTKDSSGEESEGEPEEKEPEKFNKEIEMDEEEEYFDVVTTKATKRGAKETGKAPKAKKRKLTPEELAIAEQLIYSSKSARELEEFGWNRYANNDDGLPDWFVEDEKKHYKKTPPVTKEQVQLYKERLRELNARPCKKVAQAKARKQRRIVRRLETAKKKAEGVLENDQMVHSEKVKEMKKIYSRARRNEYKKPEIVVMSKGKKGKVSRPNGRYKLVDSRMKKDLRAMKNKEKTKGRKKKR